MCTEISKELKLIRNKTGDSLRTMSAKLKISAAYLSAIENGKRNIPSTFLNAVYSSYVLDEAEKKRVRNAVYSSMDSFLVDMSSLSEKKRDVLITLTKNELAESTVEKLCAVIEEDNKRQNQ